MTFTAVNKWTIKDYMIRNLDGLKEGNCIREINWTPSPMEPADFMIMRNQRNVIRN